MDTADVDQYIIREVVDTTGLNITAMAEEPLMTSNRKETVFGAIIPFMIISYLCVFLRTWTRIKVVRAAGWDDALVVISLLTITTGAIALMLSLDHGVGQHMYLITVGTMKDALLYMYIVSASYTTATCFIKLSLFLQYQRIFQRGTFLHRTCTVLIVFTSLWGLAYGFMAWFPCFPPKNFWTYIQMTADASFDEAHCYGYGSLYVPQLLGVYESHAAINMVLDLVVLAIPVPLYWAKDSNTKTKRGLLGLLFVGVIVNFVSMWRFAVTVRSQVGFSPYKDLTWWNCITLLLAQLEVLVASICASVPVFWPVLSQRGMGIFITQEVRIEREDRWQPQRPLRVESSQDALNDGYVFSAGEETPAGHHRLQSRGDSKMDLTKGPRGQRTGKEMYQYEDAFPMTQVGPASPLGRPRHSASAMGQYDMGRGKRKWWRLGN